MAYCPECGFDSEARDGRCASGHRLGQPVDATLPEEPLFEAPAEPLFDAPPEPVFEAPAEPLFDAPPEPVFEAPAEPLFDAPAEPAFEMPAQPVFRAPAEPLFAANGSNGHNGNGASAPVEPLFDDGHLAAAEPPSPEPAAAPALEGASFTITLAPPTEAAPPGVTPAPAEPRRRTGRRFVRAAMAAVVLIAAATSYLVLAGGSASGETYRRLFVEGEKHQYVFETKIVGGVDFFGETQSSQVEVKLELTEETLGVDPDGTGTVRYTVDLASATVDGVPLPPGTIDRGYSFTFRVAPDGRVLSNDGGERVFGLGETAPAAALFGFDSMSPLLPEGKVAAGDTWAIESEVKIPFAEETMPVKTEAELLRLRDVAGQNAAVVRSSSDIPLDFTVDPAALLSAFESAPGAGEAPPEGTLPKLPFDVKLAYKGTAKMLMTSTILRGTARPVLVEGHGTIDAKLVTEVEGLRLGQSFAPDVSVDIDMTLRDIAYDEDVLRGGAPGSKGSEASSGASTTYGKAIDRARDAADAASDAAKERERQAESLDP